MRINVIGTRLIGVAMLSFALGACGMGEGSSNGFSLGVDVGDKATSKALGLPAYPGAKPYKDHEDDTSAADIGISTPLFGLRVAAAKLETPDKPEKVARFYRDALAKHGEVLECPDKSTGASKRKKRDDALTCDDDHSHSLVYKVGTKNDQRIVAIDRHGDGTRFSLVRVDVRGD